VSDPCGLADPAQASLVERAAAAASVATMQEPAAAAGPICAHPISRFPGAPWGYDGYNGCATTEPTRVGGLIRQGLDHDDDGRHASARVWRARRGQGVALADTRFRRGQKGSAAGGRRVRGWLADTSPSQATQLRWDRRRRTSLWASCDDVLP
jgi:hypothetical protein